jgi:hypothetical protein
MVLIWGGNIDADSDNVGLIVDAETGAMQTLTAIGADRVPIWASGAFVDQVGDGAYRVLIAGGVSMTVESKAVLPASSHLELLLVSATDWSVTVDSVDTGASADYFARVLAPLIAVSDGTFLLAGGINSFSGNASVSKELCNGDADSCFTPSAIGFALDLSGPAPVLAAAGEQTLPLSVGSLGAPVVPLNDGSFLVGGGLRNLGGEEEETPIDRRAEVVRFSAQWVDLCADAN